MESRVPLDMAVMIKYLKMMGKLQKSTTFSAPFLLSSIPLDTKTLCPMISFGVKITDIENQYGLYSRTCTYEPSILEGVDFTV